MNESYSIAIKEIGEQYKLIREEKERILNSDMSFILNMENSQETNIVKSYKLNYKCISYLKPKPGRITYVKNDQLDRNCIDIYLSEPRTDLIKKILDSIENPNYNELFLHGGAGIGKTHLLLDAVARARLNYLTKDFHTKPNRLIFYFLINQIKINRTQIDFSDELLFSCYPLLKYEQNVLKSNKLEHLFIDLFMQSGITGENEVFWKKVEGIHSHIQKYDVKFFMVLDQINEIQRENKLKKNKLMWMEDSLDEMTGKNIMLKCASNNNETMRGIYLKDLKTMVDAKTK